MADIKRPSLVSGGDYGSIGKGGGGGGSGNSNTIKIALIVLLFLAAGFLIAWNFHLLPSIGGKKVEQASQLKPEEQKAAKAQEEEFRRLEDDPDTIIGGE
jgi:flagellar basal body-associated protein FliL